jgi:hypothetical protein
MYWTNDGIFTIQLQQQDKNGEIQLAVVPMTYTTIQTFFDEIPNNNKAFARGFFDQHRQIVQWLYSSTASSTIEDNYTYDKILVFDARSGAFYPWTISDTNIKVHGIFVTDAPGAQITEYTVIDAAAETVIDAASEVVVAYAQSQSNIEPVFKYIVSYPFSGSYKFTMADKISTNYIDWFSYDSAGEDYDSYFITGYKIRGNAAMKFQSTYVFFYNEGNGRYDVQGLWNYAVLNSSGKFTSKQRLIYNDSSYSNAHKKIKIRGSGQTLQYKVTSVSGEPFMIIGWAAVEAVNQIA